MQGSLARPHPERPVARGRERATPKDDQQTLTIEAITVMVADRNTALAQSIRHVAVSLPRVRFGEGESP